MRSSEAEALAVTSISTNSDSMFSVVSAVASYPSSAVISASASPVVVAVASAAEEAVTVVAQASSTEAVKATVARFSVVALSKDSTESSESTES